MRMRKKRKKKLPHGSSFSRSSRVRIRRCGHGCALVLRVPVFVCSVPYVTSSRATDPGADRGGGGFGDSRPCGHAARIPAVPVREPGCASDSVHQQSVGHSSLPHRQVRSVLCRIRETPLVQCLGKVVAAPVVVQRQVPGGQDSAELFGGAVVDVPVTGSDKFQQFTAQLVQKTVDCPQVQFLDKVLDVPVVVHQLV